MRSLVFLASVLWVGTVFGGTLIGESTREEPGRVIGQVSYGEDEIFALFGGGVGDGSTIGYIDFYGTASRLELMYRKLEGGKVTDNYGTVASAQPEDLGDGWTRFSFRGLGIKPEMRRGETGWYTGFGEGTGVHLGFRGASFPLMEGFESDPPLFVNSLLVDGGSYALLDYPAARTIIYGTRETLDPPFGDATGDGRIDIADFGTLKDGFGQPTTPYQNGDVTGNLTVDMTDFGILKQNLGWRQAAVPEPSGWVLAFLAAIGSAAIWRCGKPTRTPQDCA